jgi:serine phosphatase RsbU (regulator of sigma subunit)
MGKNALKAIIRNHAAQSAQAILDAIFQQVHAHRNGKPPEDDATLVVVKVLRAECTRPKQ